MYISNINSASIKLDSIHSEKIPSTGPISIESKDHLVLLYLIKGATDFNHNGHMGQFKKKDLVLINPNQTVQIQPIRKLEWIRLNLNGIVFTSSAEVESDNQFFLVPDNTLTLRYYLDLALMEYEQPFRGSDIIIRKLIECMMVHILRHHELSIKDSNMQIKHHEIEDVKKYIRENYASKVTLDTLSELVNINKYYLIRLFKQQTGLSPIDYLIHVRLSEAEKLLTQTSITVSKISDIVGFHSPSHFSKTFKESNHMTPSAYRKRYAHNSNINIDMI